jgi:hypothetical protein
MSADLIVPNHFTTMFHENWSMLAQQKQARIQNMVLVETGCTGEKKTHNQVGQVNSMETTGTRYQQIPIVDLPTKKRAIYPRQFSTPTHEDKWDERGLMPTIAPRGKHTMAHAAAYGRDIDDIIIEALGGTAYTGATGTTATALPSTQKVAKDYVVTGSAADSSFEVFKIIRALEILADNDAIDDDELSSDQELFGLMTPKLEAYLRYLINQNSGNNKLFSKDFTPPTLDDRGRIKRFLGINWKVSTRPGLIDTTDTTIHYAYVWTKSGVQLDFWEGMTTTVDRLPQTNNAVQFLSQYSMGATRLEEEKVVQIACDTVI